MLYISYRLCRNYKLQLFRNRKKISHRNFLRGKRHSSKCRVLYKYGPQFYTFLYNRHVRSFTLSLPDVDIIQRQVHSGQRVRGASRLQHHQEVVVNIPVGYLCPDPGFSIW